MRRTFFIILVFLSIKLIGQNDAKSIVFNIDINADKISIFDFIESIDLVRLEETEQSLLKPFDWYFETKKGVVVPDIEQGKRYRLVLFDNQGNYRNHIDRSGSGPNEYKTITSAWYRNEKIEIFSSSSRSILRFNEDGKYIETQRAHYPKSIIPRFLMPYQKGYVFQQLDPSSHDTSFGYFQLGFTDEALQLTHRAVYNQNPNPLPFDKGRNFTYMRDRLLYKKPLSDSIFEIKNEMVYPLFKFDFGDKWAWLDKKNVSSLNMAINTILNSKNVYEVIPIIGKDYIILKYFFDTENQPTGMVHVPSGRFNNLDIRKQDKTNFDLRFLKWNDGYLLCSLSIMDLEEFLQNLDKDQWTIKGGFELNEILYSENPVLLSIKFKENIEK